MRMGESVLLLRLPFSKLEKTIHSEENVEWIARVDDPEEAVIFFVLCQLEALCEKFLRSIHFGGGRRKTSMSHKY